MAFTPNQDGRRSALPHLNVIVELPAAKKHKRNKSNLFRFHKLNGENVFAHYNDLLFVETSDHLLPVSLVADKKILTVYRRQSLEEFFDLLPSKGFIKFQRFYIININRITGFNTDCRWLQFDSRYTINYKREIPPEMLKNLAQ